MARSCRSFCAMRRIGHPRRVDALSPEPCNILSVAGRLPPWSPGDLNLPARLTVAGMVEELNAQSLNAQSLKPQSLNPQCSAKGCRAPAVWALRWNNPKLHTPDHRKTWLAC